MTKFHSPYQFIPIDTDKAHKEAWDNIINGQHQFIRHDRWVEQGIHAHISCTITTKSPLLIGAEQQAGSENHPGTIEPYTDNVGNPALPANSLRGMIAHITETISQSSLRVLADQANTQYSIRKPPSDALKKIGILIQKDDKFYLYPLPNSAQWKRIKKEQIPDNISSYQHSSSPDILYAKITNSVASNASSKATNGKQKGIIYQRGMDFDSKKWETFIPWKGELGRKIDVSTDLVEQLNSMIQSRHKQDKKDSHLPIGYRDRFKQEEDKETMSLVRSGDLIYYQERNNKINEIAYSAIGRKSVKGGGNLYDSLQMDSQPWNKNRQMLTPAECLFGVVEDNPAANKASRNLASRIRFSDGNNQQGEGFEQVNWILKNSTAPNHPRLRCILVPPVVMPLAKHN
jgi:CRISPR-associated protein (TIGR03986 family)